MSHGISEYAEVAIPLGVFGSFTYRIPGRLRDDIRLGARVEVPWGPKITTAFVVGFRDDAGVATSKIREIRAILDDEEPALLPEIIELCVWAAGYYIAPLGEMLRAALPANMAARGRRVAVYSGSESTVAIALDEKRILEGDLDVLRAIETEKREVDSIVREFPGARGALARLRDAGLVAIADRLSDARGVRFDRFVILDAPSASLPPKQQAIVDLLAQRGGEMSTRALEHQGASAASLATLVKKGIVRIEKRPRQHTLDAFLANLDASRVGDLIHHREQREAIAAIRNTLGSFAPFLLQGITGSGKTEVYIEAMREVVRRGEQAIFLVPEISLTPVLAARLKERFGDRIAILHSNLSASERYDQWWRARRGIVDVAIGPRSALFTPFPRLGIIIVDEEGDAAY
ncbi:MAG TPA: DEAD/DEAH box helicase, partial [Thermoanaerobaculia bacterium]